MNLGQRLTMLREQANLSQRDLAQKINSSQTVISNYERNITKPRFEHIIPLAVALNVSTDTLLGANNTPNSSEWLLNYLQKKSERLSRSDNVVNQLQAAYIKYLIQDIKKEINNEIYK